MYVPPEFRESRLEPLLDLMRADPFATLITHDQGEAVPLVSHVPLLADVRTTGGESVIVLRGHLARGNPQQGSLDGARALCVFSGPHGYVSSSFYEVQPSVPTWNYAAVHASGTARVVTDAALEAIVEDSFRRFEASPRSLELPADYRARMLLGIVGFEIRIDSLEGKLKLSQNKSPADRASVIAALEHRGHPGDAELAAMMRKHA